MMMIDEDLEEEFYEEIEKIYLKNHSVEDLKKLCIECGEPFHLTCSKSQEEAIKW